MRRLSGVLPIVLVLFLAAPAAAQDFRGRINGTVTDTSNAVLPGVTVTAASPALIQQQVQVTGAQGDYRFIALPPGMYTLTFDLPGFQSVRREGIRVVINQTLTVDMQMAVATLEETVTVTGESPIVDTSTTTLGTNFTNELLTEIPNARDIWAAMSQSPGLHMTGYDVGGSHTGTQTGYITYGMSDQNQTKLDGIDTTEGTSANAGYFDFGSFEEFQVGGGGNNAEVYGGGANLTITVKSGGDRFSGMFYGDWEGDSTITDNVPAAFQTARQRDEDGFFARSALARGNPIDRQYDINANVGGPLWKGKAWFFYSYRLNDQYKTVIGIDTLARSKLTNAYTFKGTFQLGRNNQIIGFLNKREKLQELRGLGPTTPVTAARFQSSRNYPMKIEWTSVLGSRAFLDVTAAQWYNFFPLRPTDEAGLFSGAIAPGRIDLSTSQRSGYHSSYFDQKRFKPQFYANLAYYHDGWGGSHDFKVGYDWKRDRRQLFRDQPFDIFYRDRNGAPNEVELYNTPVTGINDVEYNAVFVADTWKMNPRLTVNWGLRWEHYRDGWPDQSFTPNGHPQLAGWSDPVYQAFIAPVTVQAVDVSTTSTLAPRLGFAYDLTGDNRTVLKGFFGRFYFNSSGDLADLQNPVGRAQQRYRFNDLNGNALLDGPGELGRLLRTVGGAGFVRVDPNLERPYAQEASAHLERELRDGLSGRVSYVYKNVRNEWAEIDLNRVNAYTIPFTTTDPGVDGIRGTSDDQTLNLLDRPAGIAEDRVVTNPDDPAYDSDFNSVEFAVNRRFRDGWMLLGSVGYTWLNQFHGVSSSTSSRGTAGISKDYNWQPNQRLFGDQGKETTRLWNYKIVGRYTLPFDVGFSGSWKVQSGRPFGRSLSVRLPGAGTETVRVESASANYAPAVGILDFRLDKSFSIMSTAKVTAMMDVFNLFNDNTVTNFRITGGSRYKEVIAILDPRIVRFGLRVDF